MFKIRRKSNGKFFTPGYRDCTWDENGKVYTTLLSAKSAARQCGVMMGQTGIKKRLPSEEVEVVEFKTVEIATYNL